MLSCLFSSSVMCCQTIGPRESAKQNLFETSCHAHGSVEEDLTSQVTLENGELPLPGVSTH